MNLFPFLIFSLPDLVMCGMKQDGGLLVIDPEGQVYTCPAFVGRDGFSVRKNPV